MNEQYIYGKRNALTAFRITGWLHSQLKILLKLQKYHPYNEPLEFRVTLQDPYVVFMLPSEGSPQNTPFVDWFTKDGQIKRDNPEGVKNFFGDTVSFVSYKSYEEYQAIVNPSGIKSKDAFERWLDLTKPGYLFIDFPFNTCSEPLKQFVILFYYLSWLAKSRVVDESSLAEVEFHLGPYWFENDLQYIANWIVDNFGREGFEEFLTLPEKYKKEKI